MTRNKHLKRRTRSRAAQTGESYASALRKIRQEQEIRMSTTSPTEAPIACCSFCGKPNTSVAKLVAGPGVYICNECVELSAAIVEEAAHGTKGEISRRRREYEDLPSGSILAMLPNMSKTADRIAAELAGWVYRLREMGVEWKAIADAAGITVDNARERFGDAP
jgi:hypothetical protein